MEIKAFAQPLQLFNNDLYEQLLGINCSMAGCFPEKLRCCLIVLLCQGRTGNDAT